jgi:nucleoside-diphosphate-sugar epimerase
VRALVRREDPHLETLGVEQLRGGLESPEALAALVDGAGSVVHAAGLVRAPGPAAYTAANADGTARLAEVAAARAEGARFLLVSSLAARAPALSAYAASKRQAERELERRAGALVPILLRPPAIYGPGDRATLPILAQLARGWLVAPRARANRFSLIYVEDLAELVVRLVERPPEAGTVLEPDDARPGGYGWHDLAEIAGARTGRRVRVVELPRPVLAAAAWVAELGARPLGAAPVLCRGKVAELFHPDWLAGGAAGLGWTPATGFGDGLERTLAWYRAEGWL